MTPRVLIVDDDPLIRELLQAYLSQEGYTVHCAATAELADTFLASNTVDLVMLDIRLPGKDGLTLTRELRVRSEVGIILITGRNDEIDRIVGLECGADDYVIKPLNPRELVSRAKTSSAGFAMPIHRNRSQASPGQSNSSPRGHWTPIADG